ncbi:MAG: limonene-1,2-epoxide hydrolase [Maricaulis sp.]|nr:limonene-1,2-epoxide hydrolase [Maricaulis sp.]
MALIETVHRVINAWKTGDIETVLDQLDEDVTYHYVVGHKPLEGRDKVRRFLEKFGAGQTEIAWRITHHLEAGNRLFVEGVDDYVDADGVRIQTPYAGVFEFRNGKIWRWRDYVDTGAIAAAKRGEPVPEWVLPLLQDQA